MKIRFALCLILVLISSGIIFAGGNSEFTIDEAIEQQAAYVTGVSSPGTTLAIINISSPSAGLSEYIIRELPNYIVGNSKDLVLVDRHSQDVVQREIDFQLSGEVSDDQMVSIGKKIGAQAVITGSITQIADSFRFSIKMIDVETSRIVGSNSCDVKSNKKLLSLAGIEEKKKVSAEKIPEQKYTPPTAQKTNQTGEPFYAGFYLGYNFSLGLPYGFSMGLLYNRFGFYFDTEMGFANYQDYGVSYYPTYNKDKKISDPTFTYNYEGETTISAFEQIFGMHYAVYFPYLWLTAGVGYHYGYDYALFSKYKTSDGSYQSTKWYEEDLSYVNLVLQAGILFKYKFIYATAKYKYVFSRGSNFDVGIGYVWDLSYLGPRR